MVMNVVDWAMSQGSQLDDLITGAVNQNPYNLELAELAQQFGLDEGAGDFEAYVLESSPAIDIEDFHKQMRTCERAVCRIEGPKFGTGLLVAPGLVVTNHHVVDGVTNGRDVSVTFDYKMKAGGNILQEGTQYKLQAGSRWLAASSPQDALDYALLRVAGNPEKGTVNSQEGAPVRGHVTPKAQTLTEGDILYIIQHPRADTQKFASGVVNKTDLPKHHVYYTVNTELGSSGAPCFDAQWRPVALHHWGSDEKKINRGVIFSEILDDWKRDEKLFQELKY
jgi:V8-like Glu-specific endopeptidase